MSNCCPLWLCQSGIKCYNAPRSPTLRRTYLNIVFSEVPGALRLAPLKKLNNNSQVVPKARSGGGLHETTARSDTCGTPAPQGRRTRGALSSGTRELYKWDCVFFYSPWRTGYYEQHEEKNYLYMGYVGYNDS